MGTHGLSAAEQKSYQHALASDTSVRLTVRLMRLDHTPLRSIDPVLMSGQVNLDRTADVDRTLQADFLDPDNALQLDTDAPTHTVGGLNRLIQVVPEIWVPELGRWHGEAAFTGRPSAVDRNGAMISLEAQGKECLHLRRVPPSSIPEGAYVVKAIRDGLVAAGETHFNFPSIATVKARVPRKVPMGGPDDNRRPWIVWDRIATKAGLDLFYDGRGYATLRPIPQPGAPVMRFSDTGTYANILDAVERQTDLTIIRNRVQVTGHTRAVAARKGHPGVKSKPLTTILNAPAGNDFSAHNLAVGTTPWATSEYYDDPDLHTKAAVDSYARQQLNKLLLQRQDISFPAIPVWHLDPGDWVRVLADGDRFWARTDSYSTPFGPDTPMTFGWTANVRSHHAGKIGRDR